MSQKRRGMTAKLKEHLALHPGWDELYQGAITGLGNENSQGERAAICPLPGHDETKASFSVNIRSGLWNCFGCKIGGDWIGFLACMQGERDEKGELVSRDYKEVEREEMLRAGLMRTVDTERIKQCAAYLKANPHAVELSRKPWDAERLIALGIGYDPQLQRFLFPLHTIKGKLFNAKQYGGPRGASAKMTWAEPGMGDNVLFPHRGWTEATLILVEGEPDALTLRSLDFAGVSGTLGAVDPVPLGEWWRNKRVYVLMDVDTAGIEAADRASRLMVELAAEVWLCALPDWQGRPDNADISDYVGFLYKEGWTRSAIQLEVQRILEAGHKVEPSGNPLDETPKRGPFQMMLDAEQLSMPMIVPAKVVAVAPSTFCLPTQVQLHCPHGRMQMCQTCPMHLDFVGQHVLDLDPRERLGLSLIRLSDQEQMAGYKRVVGIPPTCGLIQADRIKSTNVATAALMRPSTEVDEGAAYDDGMGRRKEAFVLLGDGEQLEPNKDYDLKGVNYADPKDQRAVYWSYGHTVLTEDWTRFRMSEEIANELLVFKPRDPSAEGVWQKLCEVADDLSEAVTGIHGRMDLHLAYRSVWHSVLAFQFKGSLHERGWLEALVIGDTRCGKSAAFQKMAAHYRMGVLVDCKNQTVAGILGTVVQSSLNGEWMCVPGLLPQNDGRIVGFDEFHGKTYDNQMNLIATLAQQRNDGVVRIEKAARATFPARVRTIYMANPDAGQQLAECSKTGVAYIPKVIGQPQDIARFDFAMAVTTEEVDKNIVNSQPEPRAAVFGQRAHQLLLKWTYSRRPDQIVWADGADEEVLRLAAKMFDFFHASIPLVEPSYQRFRVAKLAISVAAQTCSTDADGERIVVRPCHVHVAARLFKTWYEKPSFGYHTYSLQARADDTLRDPAAVASFFSQFGPRGRRLAELLLENDHLTERTFGLLIQMDTAYVREWIAMMSEVRALRLVKGERWEKTPAFTRWLRAYLLGVGGVASDVVIR